MNLMKYRTSIDCCKNNVAALNGHLDSKYCNSFYNNPMNPLVGDEVIIHRTPTKLISLKVLNRTWHENTLEVELGLNHIWASRGLAAFTKWVESPEPQSWNEELTVGQNESVLAHRAVIQYLQGFHGSEGHPEEDQVSSGNPTHQQCVDADEARD